MRVRLLGVRSPALLLVLRMLGFRPSVVCPFAGAFAVLPGPVLRVFEHYGFRPCQSDGEAMCLSFLRPIRTQDQVDSDLMPGALYQDFVRPPSPGGPEEDAELLGVVPSEEFRAIVGATPHFGQRQV